MFIAQIQYWFSLRATTPLNIIYKNYFHFHQGGPRFSHIVVPT